MVIIIIAEDYYCFGLHLIAFTRVIDVSNYCGNAICLFDRHRLFAFIGGFGFATRGEYGVHHK